MLSAIRRSLVNPRVPVWRTQQRALSFTAVGEPWTGQRFTSAAEPEAAASSWGPGHEFDGDAGDFVSKEVSIHDRQHARKLSGAEAIAQQEADYSTGASTACWGRAEESTQPMPKPWAQEYEPQLEQGKRNSVMHE